MEPPCYGRLNVVKKEPTESITGLFFSLLSLNFFRTSHGCVAAFLEVSGRPEKGFLRLLQLALARPERVWVISIARLRTLPPVDLQPIYVIVFDDPYMEILS